jgi:hypothetical protein
MATFAQWLDEQKTRQDPVGEAARIWVAAEGGRPRVHSPSGVHRWFRESDAEGARAEPAEPMLLRALEEYRNQRSPQVTADALASLTEATSALAAKIDRILDGQRLIMAKLGIVPPQDTPVPAPAQAVSEPAEAGETTDMAPDIQARRIDPGDAGQDAPSAAEVQAAHAEYSSRGLLSAADALRATADDLLSRSSFSRHAPQNPDFGLLFRIADFEAGDDAA